MLNETQISYDDICIIQGYSNLKSRSNADISQVTVINGNTTRNRNPMIVSPMVHTLTKEMLRSIIFNGMMFTVHRYFKSPEEQLRNALEMLGENSQESMSPEYWADLRTLFFAVGKCTKWIDYLYQHGVRQFTVDFAQGYSETCIETVKYIKFLDKNNIIMAGNVETEPGIRALMIAGANYIRCGIASGSICSTSKNTAVGRPIVSALLECSKARDQYFKDVDRYVYLIADGGIRGASDIARAIGCGADYVMCGKLFAATSSAVGPFYDKNRYIWTPGEADDLPVYVEYAGMSSHKMRLHNNSHQVAGISIEGESGLIRYTGSTEDMINNVEANLRASLSYVGARNWLEFREKVVFAKVSNAGMIEKKTHLDIND